MLNRYPDKITVTLTTEVQNGTAFPTYTETTLEIVGRFEAARNPNKDLDMLGFYACKERIAELDVDAHALDGKTVTIHGHSLTIAKAINYQTHAEIWLD